MAGRFTLKLSTWLQPQQIEFVLEAACKNPYALKLAGVEDTDEGPRKIMKISFETADDRKRFKATFQHYRDRLPKVEA
ncbi:MAG: hypothetical protein CMG46_10820 [Candidatus Marinimicrobia bacterium]|nr:hypothetical protein [Candidatus Neomarinimicrobiota bacterium]